MSKEDWAWDQGTAKKCEKCGAKPLNYAAHVLTAHKAEYQQYLLSKSVSNDVQMTNMPKRIRRLFGFVYD